jgi:hypothetical protein
MFFSTFAAHVRYALLILILVILIILLSKWTGASSTTVKVIAEPNKAKELVELSQNMLAQADAAQDGTSALMSVAYADAYADAAIRVAGEKPLHIAGLKGKIQTKQAQLMHAS